MSERTPDIKEQGRQIGRAYGSILTAYRDLFRGISAGLAEALNVPETMRIPQWQPTSWHATTERERAS